MPFAVILSATKDPVAHSPRSESRVNFAALPMNSRIVILNEVKDPSASVDLDPSLALRMTTELFTEGTAQPRSVLLRVSE